MVQSTQASEQSSLPPHAVGSYYARPYAGLEIFASPKPDLAASMVSRVFVQRRFRVALESAFSINLDTRVDVFWSDRVGFAAVLSRPDSRSYRAAEGNLEDFFIPRAVMCYDPIGDATQEPPFGSQRRGETPQEVLERF